MLTLSRLLILTVFIFPWLLWLLAAWEARAWKADAFRATRLLERTLALPTERERLELEAKL